MVADQCCYPEPHQQRFLDRPSNSPAPGLLGTDRWERLPAHEKEGQRPRAMRCIERPPNQAASFVSPTLPLLPPSFSAERASLSLLRPNSLVRKALAGPNSELRCNFSTPSWGDAPRVSAGTSRWKTASKVDFGVGWLCGSIRPPGGEDHCQQPRSNWTFWAGRPSLEIGLCNWTLLSSLHPRVCARQPLRLQRL